jgi:hypothetical protein
MNDPGRSPFVRTKAGKQLIAQLIVTAGVLLNLTSIFLQTNPHVDANLLHGLNGLGLGLVLVGIVAMFVIRKGVR